LKEEVENFYEHLKSFYSDIVRTRSKTVSTREFKEMAIDTYETWKTEIEPMLKMVGIENNVLTSLDGLFDCVYKEAKMRVANVSNLRAKLSEINNIFLNQIVVAVRTEKLSEPTINLMKSATFLGLDTNWSLATCALQLQEVGVTLVAKRKNIKLDKAGIERLLKKKIEKVSFNNQYEAFRRQVKISYGIKMPLLTQHLRKMRTKVLHEGYNPEPEETKSIVSFTVGLLQKLNDISKTT